MDNFQQSAPVVNGLFQHKWRKTPNFFFVNGYEIVHGAAINVFFVVLTALSVCQMWALAVELYLSCSARTE